MDQKTALAKLRKLLGPDMGYRVNPKALPEDEREQARAELRDVAARHRELDAAMTARREVLLAQDPEYVRMRAELAQVKQAHVKLTSVSYAHRITVGVSGSMFFSVQAEGDNWDEVVALVTKKKA